MSFPERLVGRSEWARRTQRQGGRPGSYSGYVNVTPTDWLFYWYFRADSSRTPKPLLVWSNGGPGCSAMEGATTEISPLRLFDIKRGWASATGQLSDNAFAWSAHASLLFVDQPRYVGYSFGSGPHVTSSAQAGQDMVTFLIGWLRLFPEHAQADVILASESYGGHYVPAWSDAILAHNDGAAAEERIRLRGLLIGNGKINQRFASNDNFEAFLSQAHLLPPGRAASQRAPWENEYSWRVRSQLLGEAAQYLGYTPNGYDYRVRALACPACVQYNYTAWSSWFLTDEVRRALHVCGDAGRGAFAGSAAGCIRMPGFSDDSVGDGHSEALGRSLDRGVKVALLYGKQDSVCDFVQGLATADHLPWSGAATFRSATMAPLRLLGAEIGQWKASGGLSWYQIDGAGHMVPLDAPAAALGVLERLVREIKRGSPRQEADLDFAA